MTTIRVATPEDAGAIAEIYAPFCTGTPISFETEPPTVGEMAYRIKKTLEVFPWLVCEDEQQVIGYAYASRHRERAGYRWSADVSVYVRDNRRRSGIGRALYTSLFAIVRLQGFYNILAGITLPNPASVALHERMGLRPVALYPRIGFKCGAWHDVGWWQLELRPFADEPEEAIDFPSLRALADCAQALNAGAGFLQQQPM
jgi:phosphinothricin acetyltransferase